MKLASRLPIYISSFLFWLYAILRISCCSVLSSPPPIYVWFCFAQYHTFPRSVAHSRSMHCLYLVSVQRRPRLHISCYQGPCLGMPCRCSACGWGVGDTWVRLALAGGSTRVTKREHSTQSYQISHSAIVAPGVSVSSLKSTEEVPVVFQ